MNILVIAQNPMNGCNYHRQLIPLTFLKKYGVTYDIFATTNPDSEISHLNEPDKKIKVGEVLKWENYDLVFMIRYDADGTIDRAHEHGLKVLYDLDDYWHLHNTHNLYKCRHAHGQILISNSTRNYCFLLKPCLLFS